MRFAGATFPWSSATFGECLFPLRVDEKGTPLAPVSMRAGAGRDGGSYLETRVGKDEGGWVDRREIV